jgi:orotidine-5'-phosphate decarboxylase
MRNFKRLCSAHWDEGRFLSVGLDSDLDQIPDCLDMFGNGQKVYEFNRALIETNRDLVNVFKFNLAFYLAFGPVGYQALIDSVVFANYACPQAGILLDAKVGDIATTNQQYVKALFHELRADAITINPYLGREAAAPFLALSDKGIFVVCRTSNAGTTELQDLETDSEWLTDGSKLKLHEQVAFKVSQDWDVNRNCGLVAGATDSKAIARIRELAPDLPLLIPAVGKQGGNLTESVKAGKDAAGQGFIISLSSSIIFASGSQDFADYSRIESGRATAEIHNALRA